MKPTRLTQPYRSGARHPGAALMAMTRGKTMGGANPQDAARGAALMAAARRRKPPARPARPERPARPQR